MSKPKPRTSARIAAEITKLKAMKPNVRETSAFGDNHHDAIDGQIETLKKGYNEDKIYDLSDAAAEDELFHTDNVKDNALEAYRWRIGEEKMSPSKSWESLLIK